MLNALLGAPFGLTNYWYIPEYWNPSRLSDSRVGLEDILFAFAICGVMWLVALFWCRFHQQIHFTGSPNWTRYFLGTLYGLGVVHLLKFLGVGLMTGTLVSFYSLGLFILWKKPGFWLLALSGGGSFLVIYGLLLKISTTTIPQFFGQWNPAVFSFYIFSLPVEELGWAHGIGFTWPLFMAYVLDGRIPVLFQKNPSQKGEL
jgi:hypothetical protein